MGRRSKPAAVKKASGNPGKRRIVDTPADGQLEHAGPSRFPAPDWLKSERARAIFSELAPTLTGLNFIKATDRNAFSRYCEYLSLWLQLAEGVDVTNIVQVTSSEHVENMERLSKRFQAMLLLEKRLQDMEDRFGLNPAARQTLLQKNASVGRGGLFPEQYDGAAPKTTGTPKAPPPQPDTPSSAIGLLRGTGPLN